MVVYGVQFVSPTWCYGGLNPNTDFPQEGEESLSGYAFVEPGTGVSIRKYSRVACESLGEQDNIWSANGECTYVLAPDGEGDLARYNASLMCAGLNDASVTNIVASIADLSFDCPAQKDTDIGYILFAGFAGLALGSLLFFKKQN